DSVVDQTRKATDVLRADRTRVADRQAQHSRIEDEIDRVNSEISKIDEKIVEKQNELDELEPVLTRNMAILQNVEAFAPFVDALQTARGLLTVAEEGLKIARRAQRGGTTDLWMVQALPMMEEFFGWFGPRAGEFPRIVNQNLILHMETTGRCICGHEIGPGELEAVRAMAEVGDDSASRRLTSLYDLSRDWGDKAKGARDTYEEVEAELAAAYEQGQIARAALTQAQTDLDNMGDQPLQDHHNLRQNVLDQTRAQGELRALIEANTKRKAELEHERQEFTRRNIANASEELKGAEATLLAAEMVKNLASTLKEIHAAACRPKLEKWMNENYWVDTENRVIRIDEDWNIRTYDKQPDGTLLPVPGGGAETTLLTYAFAAAASKLIPAFKGAGREAMPNDQQVREAETIPLVVDAPFSSLGDNYQKTVARLLPLATSQVVLFNEASHLNRFTDMGEAGRIGKLYSVKFTGDLVEVGPDGEPRNMTKTFDFGGEEITYLVKVPDVVGSSEIVAHTFAF
ncbi:MAG: hypothetical protein QF637_00415, partial [Acidimicrobiales bacterium]|nr:hypothetical protein [Acidimicrobiales bacterium]